VFHLGGNLPHPCGIGRSVQEADRSSIPAERGAGEGIDQVQFMHGRGIVPGTYKELENGHTWKRRILKNHTTDRSWDGYRTSKEKLLKEMWGW